MDARYEPKIVGFLCNWCNQGSGAPGQAGGAGQCFPEGVRTIRVMCAALLPTRLIVEALRQGADGVIAVGCHREGECRYVEGGAGSRLQDARLALEDLGINPERLRIAWVPGGDACRLADLAADFADRLQAVGPNPLRRTPPRRVPTSSLGPEAGW